MNSADSLDSTAKAILAKNDKGIYTIPTDGLYPYQWNWDSAFAAFGFAQFNVDRAWTELDTLLSAQWDNGMVPHIIFHTVDERYFPGPGVWGGTGPIASSGISQPPIAATMARKIFDKDPATGIKRLEPLYDRLLAWHQWFMDWRLDNGAVCITHPWEAGRDNAPDWDGAMQSIDPAGVGEYTRRDTSHVDSSMRPTRHDYDRYIWLVNLGNRLAWDESELLKQNPFRVADPSMTFTLLRAMKDLAALGQALQRDVATIDDWIHQLQQGTQTLWNASLGAYDSRDVRSGAWANSISNASFLCWYAGLEAPEMKTVLHDVMNEVEYGVPSFDPRHAKFDSKRYWRGPVWGVMNMLISMGMEEMGMPDGKALRESSAALISKHGFAEYFDPLDGSPAGGDSFTWTAAIWLGWASPNAEWQ